MSKKVISKENISLIAVMSPLAGAVAFAMALPSLATAESFKISSQAELDAAISWINEEGSENEGEGMVSRGLDEAEGNYSHSITFSSSLSGQSLELPSVYLEGYYTSLVIDGRGATGLTLNMTPAYNYNAHMVAEDGAALSISNVNLNLQRHADNEAEGTGLGFGLYSYAHLELDDVTFNHNSENGQLQGIRSEYWSSVSIQNSSLIGGGIQEKYVPQLNEEDKYSLENFVPRYTQAFDSYRSGDVSIVNSTIQGFHSKYESVFEINARGHGSSFEVIDSTFSGNAGQNILRVRTQGYGYTEAIIHNSVFSGNEASYTQESSQYSGATLSLNSYLYNWGYLRASITNTSIHGNSQVSEYYIDGEEAEGIVSLQGDLRAALGNVTIANNTGASALSIYDNYHDLRVVMAHVTIAENSTLFEAEGEGMLSAPAVYVGISHQSEVNIVNSIISNNSGKDLSSFSYGRELYVDYSLIGSAEAEGADSLEFGDGNFSENPMLNTFSGNGSRAGFRLNANSPAIDMASLDFVENEAEGFGIDHALISDQSGFLARVIGDAPDMGAFEWTEGKEGEAPGNPSTSTTSGLFGSMGFGFLSSVFALGWMRRKLKK